MRKVVVIIVILASIAAAGFVYYSRGGESTAAQGPSGPSTAPGGGTQGGGAPGGGGPGGRGGMRTPMTVEFATVKRAPLAEYVLVVGNLIGEATVQVVPRVNGRLQAVFVKLGDPVRKGQIVAKIEDFEVQEQVRQAEASYKVSEATIRQRQADLKLAQTNLDRNKSLLDRELLPRQTYDDTDARHQAAVAQVDLARAQFDQAKARLDELKITLSNTQIPSPVNGFVGKRFLDPGASVGPNAPVVSVVDITRVRMVANLVEKDVKRMTVGTRAAVDVDAFPGEQFQGKVSRIAPVFDPATRTAELEIEVPNPLYRLKPGMYARVQLMVDTRPNALTVPRNAIVAVDGKQGVFIAASAPPAAEGQKPSGDSRMITAKFLPVETGIRDGEQIEVTSGLQDGARVITTGAGALKDGDRVLVASAEPGGRRGRGQGREGGQRQRPEGAK
jgi:RND family efflux transporter MFP subunit